MAVDSINSITYFKNWSHPVFHKFDIELPDEEPFYEAEVAQSAVFTSDAKRLIRSIPAYATDRLSSLAQSVAILAAAPFALIADTFRVCTGKLAFKALLRNIYLIPLLALSPALRVAECALSIINGVSTG